MEIHTHIFLTKHSCEINHNGRSPVWKFHYFIILQKSEVSKIEMVSEALNFDFTRRFQSPNIAKILQNQNSEPLIMLQRKF